MRTRSSTAKRLLKLIAGVSVMTMCAAPSVFGAPPQTETLPDFSTDVMTEVSQLTPAQAWTNVVPNALAPYYTYQPLSATDAAALQWPASLNCGTAADCYIISVREFKQPTSLDFLKFVGIPGFTGQGLLKPDGTPFVRTDTAGNFLADMALYGTTAWGYGSGGVGWQPYYPNTTTVTGNAPPAFQNVPFNSLFGAGVNGDPAATGVWHFPAPTIKGTMGRPVHVQWMNQLPNNRPQGLDPSIDCGTAAHFCYPYNRITTHVHGAHVLPQSDGLAVAWYTPNMGTVGEGIFPTSLYATTALNPTPIYSYPMDQEASTIWYHDHAIGTTHLNTNMGMAGFFPITDAHEQSLYSEHILPNTAFEHGFALQDRHFNVNAQMVMPDSAVYDKTTPGCVDDANGLPDPNTCTRLNWMKDPGHGNSLVPWPGVDPLNPTPAEILMAADPINACGAGEVQDFKNRFEGIDLAGAPFNQCAPFPAVSATLEYFGNMPVVNGVTYGQYNLEAGRVHRMRFIGGTDSRTWVMQLVRDDIDPTGSLDSAGFKTFNPAAVIPFWQIGSEQGLLNAPASRPFIDLMGGERVDVLVDLTAVPVGTTVTLHNVGADGPYTGIFELGLEPSSTLIPQIMKFNVVTDASGLPLSTVPSAITSLRTPIVVPTPATGDPVRNVALIEITDQYGRTMPTVDARGYVVPGMMVTEYILQNQTQQWDIINTTVDAHPMHIHQVAFVTLDRTAILSFDPPESNNIAGVYSQSSYTEGPSLGLGAHDAGWKDTIQCPPGHVTKVVATWDIEGEYVWHCHILSHEEHDMMRPFHVVTASAVAPPAWLGATANNGQGTIKLNWPPVAGATGYVIHESTDNFATSKYAVTVHGAHYTATLKEKADGTYQYRIAAIINGTAQTGFRTMTGSVTLNKTVAAVAWVGVQQGTTALGGNLKVWWPNSATPATFASATGGLYYPLEYLVTYTVTATPTVGLPITVAGIVGTSAVLNVPAGTYTVTVTADKASWKTSAATAAAPITVAALTLPAPAYLGAQKAGSTGVKIWWPTMGAATMLIQQNGVTIAPVVTTVGAYDQAIITGLVGGSYTYTIQNVTPGLALPSAIKTSATIVLP